MASPEQVRRNTTIFLALAGGGVALLTALAFGAGAEKGTSPRTYSQNGSTNRDCSTVLYHEAGEIKTITVPNIDAARIQDELDRGIQDSIQNLESCGEKASVILTEGISLPQPTVEGSADVIKTQLEAKQVGQQFEVTDRWNNVYLVEKELTKLKVIEIRKQVSPVIPGMEPQQIFSRNIIAVGQ